ncbi:hypothetical protein C7E25_22220, partial [Stenotrophomonas maltophilia]
MNASPPRRPSTAYRYLFVLGLGLLIGERTHAIQPFDAGEALFDLFIHPAILTCRRQRLQRAGMNPPLHARRARHERQPTPPPLHRLPLSVRARPGTVDR